MCYSHPLYHPECCPCSIYTFSLQTLTRTYHRIHSTLIVDTAIAIGPIAIGTRT